MLNDKSAKYQESCSQTDSKRLEDKSTSPDLENCIVDEMFQRINSRDKILETLAEKRNEERKLFSARAKSLLEELDEICTNGQRSTVTDSSLASSSVSKKQSRKPKLSILSAISSSFSGEEEDDGDDTSSIISSCFSSKSSTGKSGAIWEDDDEDSLSDGEVLSLGEI